MFSNLPPFYESLSLTSMNHNYTTIIFNIQCSLYNSLLKLDLDVINAIRVGNLQARIMNDVNLMKEALIRSFNN